jgi:hypothetical protein
MRYELTDREWAAIRPMLPNKPRGVPRVNDRRVLNGIFWVWRDLPQTFGPYTTCYNRFVRWRRAGAPSSSMPLATVTTNLSEGALLVIAVLFVLLGNFRAPYAYHPADPPVRSFTAR